MASDPRSARAASLYTAVSRGFPRWSLFYNGIVRRDFGARGERRGDSRAVWAAEGTTRTPLARAGALEKVEKMVVRPRGEMWAPARRSRELLRSMLASLVSKAERNETYRECAAALFGV